jgi:hypothetical protein
MTVLPEDDPAGLKHVGGSNSNSEYNSTHCAFSWWVAACILQTKYHATKILETGTANADCVNSMMSQ